MTGTTPVREALLEAAYDEVVSGSWAQTRMADVARSAGVSRQTLYNEFGTKDALADALARRQTTAFLRGVDALLSEVEPGADPDPVTVLTGTVRWTLDRAHDDPMLKAILTSVHDGGGGSVLLPFLTTRAQPVLDQASEHLLVFLRQHWPGHPEAFLRVVSETLIRLLVSHIVLPTEPAETTARVVAGLTDAILSRSPQSTEEATDDDL